MDEAVVMVAFQAEEPVKGGTREHPEPLVVRDLGVGIVGTDLVETQEDEDGRIGNAREGESFPGQDQDGHDKNNERVLQCPVLAVVGCHAECGQEHQEKNPEYQEPAPVMLSDGHDLLPVVFLSACQMGTF